MNITQEDRDLLLKYLSMALPYGIKLKKYNEDNNAVELYSINLEHETIQYWNYKSGSLQIGGYGHLIRYDKLQFKPYLRPMSSMTKEEKFKFSKLLVKTYCEEDWEGHVSVSYGIEIDNVYTDDGYGIQYPTPFSIDAIDWLNTYHFDFMDLISKGLAIEITKENDPYYTKEE